MSTPDDPRIVRTRTALRQAMTELAGEAALEAITVRAIAARVREPEGPIDDLVLFHLVSATLNLLAWWMRNLDQVDTDTMAEIIERTVLTPTSALRQSPPPALTP